MKDYKQEGQLVQLAEAYKENEEIGSGGQQLALKSSFQYLTIIIQKLNVRA